MKKNETGGGSAESHILIEKAGEHLRPMSSREKAAERLVNIADRALAALLLAGTSPLLGVLYVLHRVIERDGGPFLYRGVRVGQGGRLFMIYKIRTLVVDAEKKLHGRLHDNDRDLELKMGPFLRETRLDELPQLINVLKGDMALVGPRPERLSVYHTLCRDIPCYVQRFRVLPGITGLSQFLTPHGTSKRIRARIDLLMARKMRSPAWRFYLVAWTGFSVLRKLALKFWKWSMLRRLFGREHDEYRKIEVRALKEENTTWPVLRLSPVEITSHRMRVISDIPLRTAESVRLEVGRRDKRRFKTVRCRGHVVEGLERDDVRTGASPHIYLIEYRPESELRGYLLERHVLKKVVA